MGSRLLVQFGMIGASLFIIFAVIAPKLEDIKAVEDQAAQYAAAAGNASAYNGKLSELLNQKNSITQTQLEALEWYMPDTVDELQVMADIQYIAQTAGLEVIGVGVGKTESEGTESVEGMDFEFDEDGEPMVPTGVTAIPTDFTLSASGAYFNMKQFLGYIEFNDYPLEVVGVTLGETEEGGSGDSNNEENGEEATDISVEPEVPFTVTLRTYSFSK